MMNGYNKKAIFVFILLLSLCLLSHETNANNKDGKLYGKININSASVDEFMLLPYIGKKRAWDIVRYRGKYGMFKRIEDIMNVASVGPDTYNAIKQYISVSGVTITSPSGLSSQRVFGTTINISSLGGNIYPLPNESYFYLLCQKIEEAKDCIDICMFLFKCTNNKKSWSCILKNELIKRAKSGIHIRVLLENSNYDPEINKVNFRVGKYLKEKGISVYIDPLNITTHTKMIVIDRQFAFVGSHNFTASALKYNNEFSVMIDSRDFASVAEGYFEQLLRVANAI